MTEDENPTEDADDSGRAFGADGRVGDERAAGENGSRPAFGGADT